MPVSPTKLLFISHESSNSGAPILLLHLLKLLKASGQFHCQLVIKRGGPLDQDFQNELPTLIVKPAGYQAGKSFAGKVVDFIGYRRRLKKFRKMVTATDIVVSNTITNGRLLNAIKKSGKPVITYVHELENVMKIYDQHRDTSLSLSLSAAFFSPTPAVTENLVHRGIAAARIFSLPYYFDDPGSVTAEQKKEARAAFFEKHGLDPGKFTAVAMGSGSFRKGTDLFVKAALELQKKDPSIQFVWIGDFIEDTAATAVDHLLRGSEGSKDIHFISSVPNNPYNLLPFDVFVLSSREDPYPLVVLEAAFLEIPALCFSGTGGMERFIADDAGICVPDRSIEAMANAIARLKANPELVSEKGKAARHKALKLHADPDTILQQFCEGISALSTS